eukprot:403337573
MHSLRILYMHDNLISQWGDLNSVAELPQLIHFTLMRNPISQVPGYRHQLVNHMKNLKALDEYIITDEEKMLYLSPNAIRFRAMSYQYMKIYVPKFLENQSAEKHLFSLEVEIYRIKRLFERNSPSIRIQAVYRGFNYRNKAVFSYSQKKQAAIKIQKVVRGWLYRKKIKRELKALLKQSGIDYLLMSQEEYRHYRAVILIEKAIHKWIRMRRKIRLHNYSATIIQKVWRSKYTKHHSFLQAMELTQDQSNFYFLKEQKQEFFNILKEALEHKKALSAQYDLETLKKFIDQDDNFSIIRYPNPLTFKRHHYPIIQLAEPSYQCRVKVNNGMSRLITNGQSISKLYTRFSGMEKEKLILEKIKIRMCHFNKNDTSLIYHTRQNRMQSLKMRKTFDNYQELLVFRSPNRDVAKMICQQVFWNNLDITNENFLVFFPNLMKRVSAATAIQQSFRSYQIRKEQKSLLQSKKKVLMHPPIELCFASAIIEQRASYCISQWWKYLKLRRRLDALSHILNFIKSINQPTLYLEETIYLNLTQILQNQSTKMRIMDQQLQFDFQHPILAQNQSIQASIPVQPIQQRRILTENLPTSTIKESTISEGLDELGYHLVMHNYNDINDRFRFKPFPQWLMNEIPDFQKFQYQHDKTTQFHNSYLGIIHKSSFDNLSIVKDYNEIVSHHNKQLHLNYGLNFIQIDCCSVSEARKRALLIAFLSYDLKQRNFIRMYTQNSLTDGIFLKGLFQIWDQQGFQQAEAKMHSLINKGNNNAAEIQALRENQKIQCHQGLTLSKRDRWDIEGNHIMKFHNVQKHKEIPTHFTTRQRNQELQKLEFLFLQKIGEDETLKLEINLNNGGGDIESITPTAQTQKNRESSQVSLIDKKNQIKQSFYHITSKEPVSTLKNITLLDSQNQEGMYQQQSNQYNINEAISAPQSTKSGTAWPSSRYFKGGLDQQTPINLMTGKYNSNQGSLVNFFNSRHSTNMPSTKVNSNDQTPMNSSLITSNQQNYKHSSIDSKFRIKQQQQFSQQSYSAIMTRKGSLNKSMIGESENNKLLDMKKYEDEALREQLRMQQQYDKLGKKFEVDKIKQINQIMKQIVKVEQDANIEMYRRFNRQEKELIGELKSKEQEKIGKEQQVRRQMVISHQFLKRRKQGEREFANEFNQIRNLISKQSRIGQTMKLKHKMIKQKQELVKSVKEDEQQIIQNKSIQMSQQKLKPLISTVFDSSHILDHGNKNYQRIPFTAKSSPRIKNDFLQNQKVHLNSSQNLIDNYYYQGSRHPSSEIAQLQQPHSHLFSHQNQQNHRYNNNSDFDQIESKLYEFGMRETAKNTQMKYRGQKLTFIEENYPINQSQQL